MGHFVGTTSRVEKSSQRQSVTFSLFVVPQALYVSAVNRNFNQKKNHNHWVFSSCDAYQERHFDAFHASAMSGYPRYPTPFQKSSSKRVRVNARANNHPAHNVTIGTTTDVPGISVNCVRIHPTMKDTEFFAVLTGAINLSSADDHLSKFEDTFALN